VSTERAWRRAWWKLEERKESCVVVLEGAAAEDGGEVRLTPLNVSGLKASRKLALSPE